jgi:hypothetical protein
MQGVMTFSSLEQAVHAGFSVYDKIERGYLVRARTTAGWALAIVDLSSVRKNAR